MSAGVSPGVEEVLPDDAWASLKNQEAAHLVDVRTAAEWTFVGAPDLEPLGKQVIHVEWASFPGMIPNSEFTQDVLNALEGAAPSEMFFICRSGARSLKAARAMAQVFAARGEQVACFNVQEGFEGDLNAKMHRGGISGWKARGLPWKQS
jgi:rhodanese-related sulfurtransferase